MKDEFSKYVRNHIGIKGLKADHIVESVKTPYIIEEREMRYTQMDVFSRLLKDRIIWVSGVVNEHMCDVIQAQLLFLDNVDHRDISLYLNTPGGSVPHGLGILDVMKYVSSDVATMNIGMCASMGSVLLAGGTKGNRSSLKLSKVMTHQVSHGTQGNVQDTRISHHEAEKYNFMLFKKLGEFTGKSWKDILEYSQKDKWFNSDEAKAYGLIDEVILKEGTGTVTELMEGFSEYEEYIKELR